MLLRDSKLEQKTEKGKTHHDDMGATITAPVQFSGAVDEGAVSNLQPLSQISQKTLHMPQPVQAKMESAFQTDFSSVNFVESAAISDAGAHAVAHGNTVGFAPGKFSPETASGQQLIGHELSHVVSQAKGEVSVPQGSGLGFVADQTLEHRADTEGMKAARGEQVNASPISIAPLNAGPAPVQGKLPWKKGNLGEDEKTQLHDKFNQGSLNSVVSGKGLKGRRLRGMTGGMSDKIVGGMDDRREHSMKHSWRRKHQQSTSVPKFVETMNAEAANWIGTQLDPEELMMMLDYTDQTYTDYNGVLRGLPQYDDTKREEYTGKAAILDRALGKYKSKHNLTVYRGVRDFSPLNFMVQDAGLKIDGADQMSVDELVDQYNTILPGQLLHDKGFMSTSVNPQRARDFIYARGILMVIDVPPGTRGAPLMDFSAFEHENEFLLGSGQFLEFIRAERLDDQRITLYLRAVPDAGEEGKKK